MEQYDDRVDAYIAKAQPFAQPILAYIRQAVHEASPLITETIKWGMPFFDYKGPVCNMSGFKQHCSFGFWKASLLNDPRGHLSKDFNGGSSFGQITSLDNVPPNAVITNFIKQAIALNENEVKVKKKKPAVEATPLEVPDYFIAVLAENPKAKETFEKYSPSHRKEYVAWIVEAKAEATRQKRMATAIEWLTDGKSRHWKYQR